MRILYFGLPLGAVWLARAGLRPVATVLGHPDAPGRRRVTRGERRGLVLGRPDLGEPSILRLLASTAPDVILSFFWPKRIPEDVLALAPRGAFGVHPSLLPRWRGPDPIFWTLRAGDRETGVTLHRLAADYDTGAIVAQVRLEIDPKENAFQLARRLDRPALKLLVECGERLQRGEHLEGVPQDEALVTHAPSPSEDERAIDWTLPALAIVQLVRAAAPQPGASARLGDLEVDIVRASLADEAAPSALLSGEAFVVGRGIAVRAGDGRAVLLEEVCDVDGNVLDAVDVHRAVTLSPDGRRTL